MTLEPDPAVVLDHAILVQLLRRPGYRTVVARDGLDAVEQFRRRPADFDLVFLDVIMPRLSGRETYGRIRELPPRRQGRLL